MTQEACKIASKNLKKIGQTWRGENTHHGALCFYPIFILFFEGKVSGVSVQDMLLRLPFLKPDTLNQIFGTKTV
ncbi:hypothetical protein C6A37_02525 [Desulfobacteraceae bacterium SEEP-SAG9]|nr:hypothetical protein C6A37_02525 [Desulfobacteraceae bacterium SEEP-SAG9]